ncbi:hypothetical protein BJ508DRAFT_133853 [Ascobolus immersus RN42]|uniref:Uncharacterized protein n=1 Tax=Ascobolus immersus RN42 TaxID=1160509 RepID=A0A3N4IQE3_ASCIM|nr:hypothetical protein BJ508DRAFT_133853 [Ascobolus immersus RN42]
MFLRSLYLLRQSKAKGTYSFRKLLPTNSIAVSERVAREFVSMSFEHLEKQSKGSNECTEDRAKVPGDLKTSCTRCAQIVKHLDTKKEPSTRKGHALRRDSLLMKGIPVGIILQRTGRIENFAKGMATKVFAWTTHETMDLLLREHDAHLCETNLLTVEMQRICLTCLPWATFIRS